MTTFRSKLGRELIIPISIFLGGFGFLMAFQRIWPGFIVIVCVAIFISYIFLTTYYQIDGKTLKIRCGMFFNVKVDIDTIKDKSGFIKMLKELNPAIELRLKPKS